MVVVRPNPFPVVIDSMSVSIGGGGGGEAEYPFSVVIDSMSVSFSLVIDSMTRWLSIQCLLRSKRNGYKEMSR